MVASALAPSSGRVCFAYVLCTAVAASIVLVLVLGDSRAHKTRRLGRAHQEILDESRRGFLGVTDNRIVEIADLDVNLWVEKSIYIF